MKNSKVILLALFALAFGAQAATVTETQAKAAARGWARRGHALGVRFGSNVAKVARHSITNGSAFFAVKMSGGGTLFLSGDTDLEPVLAFTSSTNDFSVIDERSPLWALLSRDAAARSAATAVRPVPGRRLGLSSTGTTAPSSESEANTKWSRLIARGDEAPRALRASSMAEDAVLDDLRVPKLLQSRWAQGNVAGEPCYNYATPENYVCGCVATALGQVLRYNHGPVEDGGRGIPLPIEEVEAKEFKCTVDGKPVQLTMEGGTYDWENMPLVPEKEDLSEEQRTAIGKLLSDIGIAQCMSYTADNSGSYTPEQACVLMHSFGYRQAAVFVAQSESAVSGDNVVVKNAVFSNLDAGYAVTLGIDGVVGGHAIVADGYGYNDSVPYVHLNMGWSGGSDLWYNLPDMASAGFSQVKSIVYNAFPDVGSVDDKGRVSAGVLSGRALLTLEGICLPMPGCTVTITAEGETEPAATVTTSDSGVWGAALEAGTYVVRIRYIDELGDPYGVTSRPIQLKAPSSANGEYGGNYKDVPAVQYAMASMLGNSWGNDLQLRPLSVRRGGEEYPTLDEALSGVSEGDVVEIFRPTLLTAPVKLEKSCTIRASGEAVESPVTVGGGAFLTVSNATVSLQNIVFAEAGAPMVTVSKSGCLAVSGLVDFGFDVPYSAVRTADAAGFRLAGPIEKSFGLYCETASASGAPFGSVDVGAFADEDEVNDSASLISSGADPNGEVRGETAPGGTVLRWAEVEVPLAAAAAYFSDVSGRIVTAARIDRIFERYESVRTAGKLDPAGTEIVVCRSDTLSRPLTVSEKLTLRGDDADLLVSCEGMAAANAFTVTAGKLTVQDLGFAEYTGPALFTVNGAAAELEFGTVDICLVSGTGVYSGALQVLRGTATLKDSSIYSCELTASKSMTYGAGVYVASGATLALRGAAIHDCTAKTFGGGVYAAAGATVRLSGSNWIHTNDDGNAPASDIYLAGASDRLVIDEMLDPVSWIGVRLASDNSAGTVFATVTSPEMIADADAFARAAQCFFSDVDVDGRLLEAARNGNQIAWKAWTDDRRVDNPAYAVVQVTGSSAEVNGYYGTLDDFFETLPRSAGSLTLTLTADCSLGDDVELPGAVTIRSGAGGPYTITRTDDAMITVPASASLTLDGVILDGGAGDTTYIYAPGGTVTMQAGSVIQNVWGALWADYRVANAVTVTDGGTFNMASGAVIQNCGTSLEREADGAGYGGGVLIDHATANFTGGMVTGCYAFRYGGGVFVGNHSTIRLSQAVTIDGNTNAAGEPSNLTVSDDSELVLTGVLAQGATKGRVGIYAAAGVDESAMFGAVQAAVSSELVASVADFVNDKTGEYGSVSGSQLVWKNTATPGQTVSIRKPVASETVLKYNGAVQAVLPTKTGYAFAESTAKDAGNYTAVATLKEGFVWEDGTTDPVTISWRIVAVPLRVRVDNCWKSEGDEDPEFTYTVEGLCGSDTAASVLTGELTRDEGEDPGCYYSITRGTLALTSSNYILDVSDATLYIKAGAKEPTPTPPPGPVPTPVPCVPFGFTAIEATEAGWNLTISPVVKDCLYTLYGSDDLSTWNPIGAPVKMNEAGPWMFTVPAEGQHRFFKVIGEDGVTE